MKTISSKVLAWTLPVLISILAAISVLSYRITENALEEETVAAQQQLVSQAQSSIEAYAFSMANNVKNLEVLFRNFIQIDTVIVNQAQKVAIGERQAPLMVANGEVLNDDEFYVDRFRELMDGSVVSTIAVRDGDDFVRISTSLKDKDGKRSVGTVFNRQGPAYAGLTHVHKLNMPMHSNR